MRDMTIGVGGLTFVVALAALAPCAAASAAIDGTLHWEGDATVAGSLEVEGRHAWSLVQHAASDVTPGLVEWTLRAQRLELTHSVREESRPSSSDILKPRVEGAKWQHTTRQFTDATVTIRLAPTQQWGSSALVYAQDTHAARLDYRPSADDAVRLRERTVERPVMVVPESSRPGHEHAYQHHVEGRVLEATGRAAVSTDGALAVVLFGWQVTVATSDGERREYDAGRTPTYDAYTGQRQGARVEYVRIGAANMHLEVPATSLPVTWYTPAFQYDGLGTFPQGRFFGLGAELAPLAPDALELEGDVWLATSPGEDAVRAWGETGWEARGALAAPVQRGLAVAPLAAAAAGMILVPQLLQAWGRYAMGAFVAGYARLRDQEGEDSNRTRSRILELVAREPGTNLSRIVRELNIGWGTAAYHTQILQRQGRLRHLRALNRVCFFPGRAATGQGDQLRKVLLMQPNYRMIMAVLEEAPGLSQKEVAQETGHARQYISRLVAKLQETGLVRMETTSTGRRYYPIASVAGGEREVGAEPGLVGPALSLA